MTMRKSLTGAMLVTLALTTGTMARSKAPTLREQEEHACANDAMTLCKDAVPDEEKITACMSAKRAQLSPECGRIFDTGTKAMKR